MTSVAAAAEDGHYSDDHVWSMKDVDNKKQKWITRCM